MNPLWSYLWPPLVGGLLVGAILGLFVLRQGRRNTRLAIGALISFAVAALWHAPFGAAARFAGQVETQARQTLLYYEMNPVRAQLGRDPLTRQLALSGPADDFQRSELVRIMGDLPGVSEASWSNEGGGLPLIAQGAAIALVGYLLGLLLAHLVGLHRRYNAQWEW